MGDAVTMALWGDFNWQNVAPIVAKIRAAEGRPVRLLVDSAGGRPEAGIPLALELAKHKGGSEAILRGRCFGVATVPALACGRVIADVACEVRLLPGTVERIDMIRKWLVRLARLVGNRVPADAGEGDALAAVYARRPAARLEEIRAAMVSGQTLTATALVRLGLADELRDSAALWAAAVVEKTLAGALVNRARAAVAREHPELLEACAVMS